MLRHDVMDSEAWISLNPVTRCIWIEVMRRYNGSNNGNIPFSCREISARLAVSKDTASRGFNDLIDRGFIRITVDSAFNLKTKRSRRWRLTHEPAHTNSDSVRATNEWRDWKNKTRSDQRDISVRSEGQSLYYIK